MKTVFSGIQPTGIVHLGNLLGAINNWAKISREESNNYFCIVDLHSLTSLPKRNELNSSIVSTSKALFSSGIDLNNSIIYLQSDLPQHSYLSWILSSYCQIGELQRMTQFKEKSSSHGTHAGLFTYPILMAADILIHKANEVPVGEDQTQHLELTRNIAERFNNYFGDVFPIPEKTGNSIAKRVMSLRHPDKKMSKSTDDLNGTIYISDSKDEIMKKFKSSVTDSENEIRYDTESKQGISNLLEIYSSINNLSISESEKEFSNSQYGEFKIAVGESVVNFLIPIQENFNEYSDEKVLDILKENATKANESADKTISVVKEAIGLN